MLADAAPGALKVVALHHHLLGAPWRSRKRTIANRGSVLGALVDAGAELIVSGHVHQSAVGERREFEVVEAPVHGTTVVTAPGLGQPRPRRRGEARGLHLFEADERTLRVLTYAWVDGDWAQIADRRFPRAPSPSAPSAEGRDGAAAEAGSAPSTSYGAVTTGQGVAPVVVHTIRPWIAGLSGVFAVIQSATA